MKSIVDHGKTKEGMEFVAVMVVGPDTDRCAGWLKLHGFNIEYDPCKVVLAEFAGDTERVQEMEQELLNYGFEYSN